MLRFGRVVGMLLGMMILVLVGMMGNLRREHSTAYWIAFSSYRDGNEEIYRMNADGSDQRRLTFGYEGLLYNSVSWSPDGKRLVFMQVDYVGEQEGLYRMNSDGSDQQRIDVSPSYLPGEPLWLPDGEWIVFTAVSGDDFSADLFRTRPDGSGLERLTTLETSDLARDFTPDGRWLVFESRRSQGDGDIYRLDLRTNRVQRLTDGDGGYRYPSVSPDGRRIIFSTWYEYKLEERGDIYQMNLDGTNLQVLTTPSQVDERPLWSPDGRWITFESRLIGEHFDINRMRRDGSDQQILTDGINGEAAHQWSPDGEWIVFYSTVQSNTDIYRMRPDGTDIQQLTHHPLADTSPQLSPLIDMTWSVEQLGFVGGGLLIGAGGLSLWGRKTKV